jgi:pimeloyl-ACP methyl ester carboxylesterase
MLPVDTSHLLVRDLGAGFPIVLLHGGPDFDHEYLAPVFGTTGRADLLDEVVRRIRIGFAPDGVVAARAIEDSLYEQTWDADDYDLIPQLSTLHIPTLVIRGENDFIPADGVRRIADAIPGARFVEIAGLGHFTFIEQPERVRSLIAEFLAPS